MKQQVDEAIKSGRLNGEYIRTCSIGPEQTPDMQSNGWMQPSLGEDERNQAILNGIKKLLGHSKQQL